MILLMLVLLVFPLSYTTCYNPVGLHARLNREEWIRTSTAVQRTHLWKACSYRFSSSRILSVVILESASKGFKLFIMHLMSEISKRVEIPITLTTGHAKLKERYTAASEHSHLLIAPNSSSLALYLESSKGDYPQNIWKPQDNFLFLILFTDSDSESNYHGIFDRLWNERGIMNVLILIKSLKEMQVEYILAYDPFLVDEATNKTLMWTIQPDKLHELPRTSSDRTSNLHGYKLKVGMFNDRPTALLQYDKVTDRWIGRGRDGQVLDIIATYMNFTPVIVPPGDKQKFGYKIKNGTFTGVMADLINRRTYLAVNGIYLKYYGTEEVEFTTSAVRHQLIVALVPKSAQMHIWIVVYKALRRVRWCYLLLSFFSCVLIWYLLRRFDAKRDKATSEASLFTNVLEMLAIFLNMPLSFLTKTKSSPQRLLLSSCLISSLFMMCNFQGLLLDVVTNPHFDTNIVTLQQLEEAELSIFTASHSLLDTFNESEYVERLGTKVTYEFNPMSIVTIMKKYKNVSLLCRKEKATWFLRRHGDGKLHIIEEAARGYFMSYVVPKGSPYLPRLRVLFGRIMQSGLMDKWDEDTKYETALHTVEQLDDDDLDTIQRTLALADVAVDFLILALGLVVSTAVFLVEVCVGRHF
ncbi:hypothetical protein Cfor_04839 [Coptotermes formosanus]|uniref:Ionotropic glutamate receptor C-terminal domain-containing protein n=1 Tax=Coptotermes formosanus TaxID=36987 RepID=A0A6L2PKI2_COPFO|nr:hypothetical protein Cfor_04839 [Coptotermes formosanus]